MEKTLLNLGKLSRTVGYICMKIVPSTNCMVCTLTVEHTDASITAAQPKDRCVKLLWCWDLRNLCLSEMIRFAVAKGKGGGGGVVSLSGLSSSQSLGQDSAILQGWMGSVAGFPRQTNSCRPSSLCWFLFFHSWNSGWPKIPSTPRSPSITGRVMNLHAAQDPH